jgi:DNA-binding MarR family transcriptional regulator
MSDLNYVGSKTCSYLKAPKATLVNDGELLGSEANIFPEQHHVCLQLVRRAGDPVAYSNKNFMSIFRFWLGEAEMMEFGHTIEDLQEQIQEYQDLYSQRPREDRQQAPQQRRIWSAFKCMMVILREIFGYHRRSAQISIKDFIKRSGLCQMTVLRSIKILEKKKFVSVKRSADNRKFNEYRIKMEGVLS